MSNNTDSGPNTEQQDNVTNSDDPALDIDRSWTQVVQTHFDPEGGMELTTAIITAIAEAQGIDPIEVRSPTLYEVVDVPAIERSFFGSSTSTPTRNATGTTQFQYEQYLVKVRSDGWIQVYE